jgi:hypothetical protein
LKKASPNIEQKTVHLDKSNIVTNMSFEQMTKISNKVLLDVISNSIYSILPYYFVENLDIKNQDYQIVENNKSSGSCVAFAIMVSKKLIQHKIKNCLIPATLPPSLIQPGYPLYGHVVTMVETETHFIIYEPAYFILSAIFVPKDGSSVTTYVHLIETTYTFNYDKEAGHINVSDGGSKLFHYKLGIITNPSESVSYPIHILNQRLPIVKYDANKNKKAAHLSIRLDTKVLEAFDGNDWLERFEWTTLNEAPTNADKINKLSEWSGLSDSQCIQLGYKNPTDLKEIVLAIIQNH